MRTQNIHKFVAAVEPLIRKVVSNLSFALPLPSKLNEPYVIKVFWSLGKEIYVTYPMVTTQSVKVPRKFMIVGVFFRKYY